LNVATARDALQIVFDSGTEFAAQVDRLVETTVTDAQWDAFLDAHVPIPRDEGRSRTLAINKRDALLKLWWRTARRELPSHPLRGVSSQRRRPGGRTGEWKT